ncbi:MAG: thiol:disulfide interchange protein DsbA/DsbL [Gammaproteobacteria bacterium]|nr:thiol:disulfide interchange protein DsbA/DsbL [Gammaproteobacteria bacterium]MDH5241308.1 thiol:disulfide interchange protein DsbA/DsbL [Gammaproteobacteria bacterium]MDH5261355.1 thiol:disulfide interchange protein DsbA/DsbL [Gammaproteobacteria bacterium]MDH5583494.1 thiol:disulfide interchange protein DsbA/DsbL [Gammaproteobacteria bacterium]
MKRIIWISTLASLALLAACGKEEAAPATDTSVSTTEPSADAVAEAVEDTATETESTVVVEESAAEVEPAAESIVLALAEDDAATRTWKFKEGTHFTRLVPTQPTVGGADKIEVAEIFMYSCPHCYDLEAHINKWSETISPNVRFVRIPAVFNQAAQLHAQLYYTEVFLAKTGALKDENAFRDMVFEEFHRKGNRLTSQAAIQRVFARAGVSEEDFNRTWNSFEVNQAMRVAADLARRYNVTSVPMVIVNGKYRTDTASAGGYPKLMEVIDELTAREGLR